MYGYTADERVDAEQIEAMLQACEASLASGGRVNLRELGFWRAVGAVKRHPDWIERYADRIAAIDRAAFERAVWPTLPLPVGTGLLSAGALLGTLLVSSTPRIERRWRGATLLVGTAALLATTHDLAHLLVGQALGMRFSHWFLDGPARVQPGLKLDYAAYLRAPASARAWMHASGALVTKIVPFAALGLTAGARVPAWARACLVAIGGLQLATDALFSVRQSDWKRFRRERRLAAAA